MSDLSYVRNNDGTYSKLVQLSGSNVLGNGQVKTTLYSSGGTEPYIGWSDVDGVTHGQNGIRTGSMMYVWNGNGPSGWDRWRNNTEGTLLASAARTASVNTANQTNYNARGVAILLDVTAASGSGGLTLQITAIVNGSSVYLNTAPTAITTTGKRLFVLYPSAFSNTNSSVSQTVGAILPRIWRIDVNHVDATSYTYSLGYSLIL